MNHHHRPAKTSRRLAAQLCLLLCVPFALAQTAPTPPAAPTPPDAPAAKPIPVELKPAPKPAEEEEILKLSPFEVVGDTKGYYSANTMSGTRFNSKLEDLGSAVTVMTKDQMSDFAMLDINDVFAYVAGTEGTGTYSDVTIDRNGSVSDNVQLDPTNANRVRGGTSANISFGNYETMRRVPIDPINIDSLEISRGPNASVFGIGNPSGTVNSVAASANLRKNRVAAQFRGDSYGGYRTSLDVNEVLFKDRLAIRGSAVLQRDEFTQKPAGTDTRRYNAMIKYKPFKSTTLSGSYSYYKLDGNRPNAAPPRDGVSFWLAAGQPTWDPVAQVIHVNGTTIGNGGVGSTAPITSDTNAFFSQFFNRSVTGFTRAQITVEPTGITFFGVPQSTNSTTLLNANLSVNTSGAGTARLVSVNQGVGVVGGRISNQPLFTTTPSVTGDLYDFKNINLAAVNRLRDQTDTYNLQLDQIVFDTPTQSLSLQLGYFGERSQRFQRNLIGIGNDNGQSGQLLVDVNEKRLDGTPNPNLGQIFIAQDMPRTTEQPAQWDTYRAQAAYRLDLTEKTGALKWLGSHTLSGYGEYKHRFNRTFSFRDAIADAQPWLPAGVSRANNSNIAGGAQASSPITRAYFRYFVGDAIGQNVDFAPTPITTGLTPFVWGNANTRVFNTSQVLLDQVATTDATGGSRNTNIILKTGGGVLQSHFLSDRLVTTFGWRRDTQKFRAGSTPQKLLADGISFDLPSILGWDPNQRVISGTTRQTSVVARPFHDFGFINRLSEGGRGQSFLGDLLNGLSVNYNKSDSFIPQAPGVTLQQVVLPNPSGKGKGYGFGLNMFEGRLVISFKHYKDKQLDKSGGDAGTIAQRVSRMDVNPSSASVFQLHNQATQWVTAVNPTFTSAQVEEEVARQMGIPLDVQAALRADFDGGRLTSTQDVISKGNELEINFNPTRFWTVSANFTENQTTNKNVSQDIQAWIDSRLPIWTTIRDQRDGQLWWTKNYGGTQTAEQNFAVFVTTPFTVIKELEGKSSPQIRRYNARFSTNVQLAGLTENRVLKKFNVGGAVRWEDKGAIGFFGKDFAAKLAANQPITELDAANPIYDKQHYFVDAFLAYKTRLWQDKIRATIQLNVKNLGVSSHLQPIGAFPDGTPHSFRIVNPQQFILTTSFEL